MPWQSRKSQAIVLVVDVKKQVRVRFVVKHWNVARCKSLGETPTWKQLGCQDPQAYCARVVREASDLVTAKAASLPEFTVQGGALGVAGEQYYSMALHMMNREHAPSTQEGYAETFFQHRRWCPEHLHYHGKPAKKISIAAAIPTKKIVVTEAMVTSTYMEAKDLKEPIECDMHTAGEPMCGGLYVAAHSAGRMAAFVH